MLKHPIYRERQSEIVRERQRERQRGSVLSYSPSLPSGYTSSSPSFSFNHTATHRPPWASHSASQHTLPDSFNPHIYQHQLPPQLLINHLQLLTQILSSQSHLLLQIPTHQLQHLPRTPRVQLQLLIQLFYFTPIPCIASILMRMRHNQTSSTSASCHQTFLQTLG